VAKPFSIQAPEDVAKEYGGNKQAIAQAAQMGIVDPTAAVLAGMFIDRMRSAQVMEAAPQQTVAQQVFAPPQPQMPQGLGQMPMGAPAPQPAPAMQAPMGAPPEMAMPGMAMGGIANLSVPDAMFDEPDNGGYGDGYSGGGLVAFADGGATGGWGDYIEQMVRSLDPNIEISGRARTPARNAQVGGVAGSYHLIDAARDIRTPEGMDKSEFIAQLKGIFGPDYDVLPSKGRSVHVEPGPKLGEKVRAGTRPGNTPAALPERDFGTAEGRAAAPMDIFGMLRNQFGPSEESQKIDERRMARAEEMASPEYYEKQRKDSMWETLAAIGFNMASSKSPYLLQAVGEAAAAALPGAQVDKKERKAAQDRALDIMGQMNDKKRKENLELLGVAVDMSNTGMKQEQFEKELQFRKEEGALDRQAQIIANQIAAAGKISDLESYANTIYDGLAASNEQGLLKKNGKPYKFAEEALRAKAMNVAVERFKPTKAGGSLENSKQLENIVRETSGQDGSGGGTMRFDAEGNLIQ